MKKFQHSQNLQQMIHPLSQPKSSTISSTAHVISTRLVTFRWPRGSFKAELAISKWDYLSGGFFDSKKSQSVPFFVGFCMGFCVSKIGFSTWSKFLCKNRFVFENLKLRKNVVLHFNCCYLLNFLNLKII